MRDLVDVTFRLMVKWLSQTPHEMDRLQQIFRYFHDREVEYETGIPVLPGWASIGNAAAQYGNDDLDPFAPPPELFPDD